MKEIKTKATTKDIKMLDKALEVSRKMKNAYIRTKDQAEQLGHNENGNYVDNAGNSVREGAETVARKAGHTLENQGKNAVQKIKERRAPDTGALRSDALNGDYARQATKSEAKETVHRNLARTGTKQAKEQSAAFSKAKEAVKQNVSQPGAKHAARQNAVKFKAKETVKRKFTLSKPGELAKRRFVQSRAKQRLTKAGEIRLSIQKAAQTQGQQTAGRTTLQPVRPSLFQPAEKTAAQSLHPSGTPGRTIRQAADTGVKSIKEVTKGMVKTAQRSIKTAGHTARAAVKTSQTTAKTAAKTAQAAQRAAQTARTAARAAAVSVKTAVKAMLATIKAIIAAAKSLAALIAAGGWIAVVVILVICLAGLLIGSVFGVFFSNESYDANTPIMTEVVSRLNEEFAAEIQRIQDENPHDTLELSGNGSSTISNWREILAVYAVKVAGDPENGMEVATLDDTKVGILRDVFRDMNKIDYWLETIEHEETVTATDEDGNETQETVTTTETILHINVTSRSHTDMIAEYGFNAQQVKMLDELMKDEYQELFMQLTGS
ncbi:MAG: hypothetical protein AB1796_06295 [Bacillota bacterium]